MAKRILFQGDSITDCGRNRNDFYGMGNGYPYLVKAALGMDYPEQYEVINRGISGNRIVDLYARIKADFINLKPDYASILIGVNDVWHEIGHNNGVATEKFEKIYDMLISEILEELPDLKLFIMAPYVLKGDATVDTEEVPDRWSRFSTDVNEKAEVAKRLAKKYNLPLVDVQAEFDKVCTGDASYWAYDGVHPTAAGHELLKRVWLDTFNKIK